MGNLSAIGGGVEGELCEIILERDCLFAVGKGQSPDAARPHLGKTGKGSLQLLNGLRAQDLLLDPGRVVEDEDELDEIVGEPHLGSDRGDATAFRILPLLSGDLGLVDYR